MGCSALCPDPRTRRAEALPAPSQGCCSRSRDILVPACGRATHNGFCSPQGAPIRAVFPQSSKGLQKIEPFSLSPVISTSQPSIGDILAALLCPCSPFRSHNGLHVDTRPVYFECMLTGQAKH